MPTINPITAPGGQRTLQLRPVSPEAYGAAGFHGLTQFGQVLIQVADKIQAQRDELQLTDLAAQLDGLVPQLQADALKHPDVKARPQLFEQRLNEARTQLVTEQRDPQTGVPLPVSSGVQTALFAHQRKLTPAAVVQLQHDSLVQAKDQNDAMLTRVMTQKAKDLATMTNPGDRAVAMNLVRQDLLERAVDNGLMTEHDMETKWNSFQQTVLEHHMDYLRQTDPSAMRALDRSGAFQDLDPLKRLKVLAEATQDEEQAAIHQEKAFKRVQDAAEMYFSAQANQGMLSAGLLESALKGQDPYITPDKAREYQKINDNPPLETTSLPIRAIMQEYHGGASTIGRIHDTRKKLNAAARELGHPNKLIDAALNELQTDERTMRTVQAAELTAGIKYAEDKLKAESEPMLPGRLGQMQKNMDEVEKADMRTRIRKGEKPDEVIKDILERKKRKAESLPKRNKGVMDLVK